MTDAGWIELISTAVTALAAVLALVLAAVQIRKARQIQNEATAREAFKNYLDKAFENPRYADPSVNGINADSEDWNKYQWFFSIMYYACEEAFLLLGHQKDWLETVKFHLSCHVEYLDNYFEDYRATCNQRFLEVVDSVIEDYRRELAPKTEDSAHA